MNEQEIITLLGGPPVRGGPLQERLDENGRLVVDPDTPFIWNYDSGLNIFGGVELRLELLDGKLTRVSADAVRLRNSSIATVFNQKESNLYWLDNRLGPIEQPAFTEYLACG